MFHRGYYRNSYNSITSASSDEELLDGAGVIMDFQTSEDDNLLDGDACIGKSVNHWYFFLIHCTHMLVDWAFRILVVWHCNMFLVF